MPAIRVNEPTSLNLHMVGGSGRLHLLPGVNLNISKADIDAAKAHPTFKKWLEVGRVTILTRTPSPEGELAGFKVTEDKVTGQPMPIHGDAPLPTASLTGVTIDEAEPAIAAQLNPDTLRSWRDADDRKGIHELIDRRLSELK